MVNSITNFSLKIIFVTLVLVAALTAQDYSVDKTHSSMGFMVKHLLISDVDGVFNDYDVKLNMVKQDIRNFEVDIEVESVDTRNQKRDKHLQSGDFFEANKYQNISFRSKSYKRISDTEGMVSGDLTIKDITKPITLNVQLSEPIEFRGKEVVAVNMDGKINRIDFNVGSDYPLAVVGDEVALRINLQVKK